MMQKSLLSILVPVLCLISKETTVAKREVTGLLEDGIHTKWISRIVSEHIWDYRINSKSNPECTRHFEIYRQHLKNFTTWAMQMFDSSDPMPGGFLVGDSYNLGNFEECINTQIPKELGFLAQYCLPTFEFTRTDLKMFHVPDDWRGPVWGRIQIPGNDHWNLMDHTMSKALSFRAISPIYQKHGNLSNSAYESLFNYNIVTKASNDRTKAQKDIFSLALCIPSTCSPSDLQVSLQKLLEHPMRNAAYSLNVTVDNLSCTTRQSPPESTGYLLMRYFINGMTTILIICSGTDLLLAVIHGNNHDITNYSFAKATGIEKWLLPFSIYRNLQQLNAPVPPGDYKILHGLKVLFAVLTIVAHHGTLGCEKAALVNWSYFENRIHNFSIFYTLMPVPDIFFCMTGFLACISMMKQLEKNTFNVWTHVINKLIRTLPPYMFVIACTVFILPYVGNGPLWKKNIEPEVEFCRTGWWTNLLFINNYYNLGHWCLPMTFYVASDMHFFIVGSIIVYLCWRWESHKKVILGTSFFLSFLLPFWTVSSDYYEGLLKLYHDFLTKPRSHEMLVHVYMKSHTRFGGYITGMAAAFLLRRLQRTGYKFSKTASWAGVFIGVFIIVVMTLVRDLLHSPSTAYNVMAHALYAGLHTQLLSIGLMTIVIIQVTTGFGDLDPLFLTSHFFVPLSRLSYWTFLLNMPIIIALFGSCKTPIHMTYEDMTYAGQNWSDIALTYIIAVYCYLIIDAPINHIKPMILKLTSKPRFSPTKKQQ